MQKTANLGLEKPEGSDVVTRATFNGNSDILDAEVAKLASTTEAGRMSAADKVKLNGVAAGANNYTHPSTHPPSIIAQDASNRFMTDAERTKLSGIAAGANAYVHPSTHPATIITEDSTHRFVTDANKAEWDSAAEALETLPAVTKTLTPGLQAINADRLSRLAHIAFSGRTLINLGAYMQRAKGWNTSYCTLSEAVGSDGIRAITFTVAAGVSTGSATIDLPLVAGASYLVWFRYNKTTAPFPELRYNNAPFIDTWGGNSGETYTSFKAVAGATSLTVQVGGASASAKAFTIAAIRVYQLANSSDVSTLSEGQLSAKYPYTEGIANVDNVYIHRIGLGGAVDQAMYAYDMQAGSNVDGSLRDEVYTDKAGRLRVNRRLRTMKLTGDLTYELIPSPAGFKRIAVSFGPDSQNAVSGDRFAGFAAIKFDGKLLNNADAYAAPDNIDFRTSYGNRFLISIANADSGWGDDFTPSLAEIQAYFNGWKMYTQPEGTTLYNGTGTKGWATDYGVGGFGNPQFNVPTGPAPGGVRDPYQLQYQLASPVDEPISQEGAITLLAGSNQIEMGSGMIVREKADIYASGSTMVYLNAINVGNRLKHLTTKILTVLKNGLIDNLWVVRSTTYNGENYAYAECTIADYDSAAVYTVTYMAFDTYLTGIPPLTITADIAVNLRGAVDGAVTDIAALTGRVDVLESGKADAEQPGWIAPTLLNGWVAAAGYDFATAAYYKDSAGIVHLRGFITSGGTTSGTVIFNLPLGFCPENTEAFSAVSADTSAKACSINVDTRGRVTAGSNVANSWLSLSGISFRVKEEPRR